MKFGHAWVEDNTTVYDYSNGRQVEVPKDAYYRLGRVKDKPGKLYRYTPAQMRQKLLETHHHGPWDLQTETGL